MTNKALSVTTVTGRRVHLRRYLSLCLKRSLFAPSDLVNGNGLDRMRKMIAGDLPAALSGDVSGNEETVERRELLKVYVRACIKDGVAKSGVLRTAYSDLPVVAGELAIRGGVNFLAKIGEHLCSRLAGRGHNEEAAKAKRTAAEQFMSFGRREG